MTASLELSRSSVHRPVNRVGRASRSRSSYERTNERTDERSTYVDLKPLATQRAQEAEKEINTSDLDHFDDEYRHAACPTCYPYGTIRALETFIAVCGALAISHEDEVILIAPANACAECLHLERCTHGHRSFNL